VSPAQARSAGSVDDLVAAARQRFGQFGYEGTSIDDIARVAGRTKGAVYHHFPDKRALFERAFAAEQQALATEVARSTTLAGGIATYLRTVASTPAAARITLLDGPAVLGWTRWRSCDDGPFRTMLRRSLDAEEALGQRYDLDLLTDLLLGAVTEAAQQIVAADDPLSTARRYERQLRALVDDLVS
jgi:AcrR family transcriptional regulator